MNKQEDAFTMVDAKTSRESPDSDLHEERGSPGPYGLRFLLSLDDFILVCVPRPIVALMALAFVMLALASARELIQLFSDISAFEILRLPISSWPALALLKTQVIGLMLLFFQIPLLLTLFGGHVVMVPLGKTWRWTHPILLVQATMIAGGIAVLTWIDTIQRGQGFVLKPEVPVSAQVSFFAAAALAWSAVASIRYVARSHDEGSHGARDHA